MTDYLSLLPPFLQEYVYEHKWKDFRQIQKEAFDVLFNSDYHLLITSGTSSGKTEAAMFPVISHLYRSDPKSIGALYVGPLKSLINDQHERLLNLLKKADIKVTPWHGDITASVKKSAITNPSGILQITPESLQTILMNRPSDARRMFKDLKFIVIDEVHAFMNSDRGLQLLCEIEDIERICGCRPVRIGLSATLSDVSVAGRWLKGNSDRPVCNVNYNSSTDYELTIFYDQLYMTEPQRSESLAEMYEHIHHLSAHSNCIVFANSRNAVESTSAALKALAERDHLNKKVLAHHGSLGQELRHTAEQELKTDVPTTVVATSTLELGIDVGDLDLVIHINSPYSCSSFVQKFGRSGRREGQHPIMRIVSNNEHDKNLFGINTDLITSIAIAESYFKDRWVEPICYSKMPFGLLYQQTISYLKRSLGVTFRQMVDNVLNMYPFRNISVDDYAELVSHLISKGHIEVTMDHKYIVGRSGEMNANSVGFVTIFQSPVEFVVKQGKTIIGTVQELPQKGDLLQLASCSWRVIRVDNSKKSVEVEMVKDDALTIWHSGVSDMHTHIMEMSKKVLCSNEQYDYLDDSASKALEHSRYIAGISHLSRTFVSDDDGFFIFPWLGTIQFETLVKVLKAMNVKIVSIVPPYYLKVRGIEPEKLVERIESFKEDVDPLSLVYDKDVRFSGPNWKKYDENIPKSLLKKAFAADRIDLSFELGLD